MIKACYFDLTGNTPLPDVTLPAPLLAHIDRYRLPTDRRRSLAAWTLLYWMAPVCPVFSSGGQPCLPDSGLYISVSHSKNLVAAAVSDAPVGIDVERIAGQRPVASLAKKCLTAAEQRQFQAAEDPTLCFYQHWTAKEAYAKLVGTGLHGYPVDVEWHVDGTVGEKRLPVVHQSVHDSTGEAYCLCVTGEFACMAKSFEDML